MDINQFYLPAVCFKKEDGAGLVSALLLLWGACCASCPRFCSPFPTEKPKDYIFFLYPEGTAAEIWYVSPTATPGNNGSSIAEPFTLVEGLAAAQGAGGEVTLVFLDAFNLSTATPFGLSTPANLNLTIQSLAASTPVTFGCVGFFFL